MIHTPSPTSSQMAEAQAGRPAPTQLENANPVKAVPCDRLAKILDRTSLKLSETQSLGVKKALAIADDFERGGEARRRAGAAILVAIISAETCLASGAHAGEKRPHVPEEDFESRLQAERTPGNGRRHNPTGDRVDLPKDYYRRMPEFRSNVSNLVADQRNNVLDAEQMQTLIRINHMNSRLPSDCRDFYGQRAVSRPYPQGN